MTGRKPVLRLRAALILTGLLAHHAVLAQTAGPQQLEDLPDELVTEGKIPEQAGLKAGEWAILPIPQSNPTIGTGLQLLVARFFQVDAQSSSSVIGGGAAAYDSGTRGVGAGGLVSFAQDQWRVKGGLGYFDARYDLFGVGTDAGNDAQGVPIAQEISAIGAQVLRRVAKGTYAGIGYFYLRSNVGLNTSTPPPADIAALIDRDGEVVDTGPQLVASYDSRDANFGPHTGTYATLTAAFASENLGGTFTYQRYNALINHYLPVGEKHTLALGMSLCRATTEAPFYAQCMYGAGGYPRGYVAGQFRDQAMYVAQAEWRTQLTARWGVTAFGALGQVGADFGDLEDLLPAGGFGLRYLVAPENRVNLSADIAWNKDGDASFYLRIGEAF